MHKLKYQEKPTIDSLIIEFTHNKQLVAFLSAVLFLHEKYHDTDVEKLYN